MRLFERRGTSWSNHVNAMTRAYLPPPETGYPFGSERGSSGLTFLDRLFILASTVPHQPEPAS